MPKQRITKEMVVDAAFALARERGMDAVQVKNVAAALGCSVQPVYCYCENIEGLKALVTERAAQYLQKYVAGRLDERDRFRSLGRAYASFAREEPQLYRLYFLRPRPQAASLEEIFAAEGDPAVPPALADTLGLALSQAKDLYFQMMIFNTGLSFMLTSLGENADPGQVEELQAGAWAAFAAAARKGREQ